MIGSSCIVFPERRGLAIDIIPPPARTLRGLHPIVPERRGRVYCGLESLRNIQFVFAFSFQVAAAGLVRRAALRRSDGRQTAMPNSQSQPESGYRKEARTSGYPGDLVTGSWDG